MVVILATTPPPLPPLPRSQKNRTGSKRSPGSGYLQGDRSRMGREDATSASEAARGAWSPPPGQRGRRPRTLSGKFERSARGRGAVTDND